MIDKLETEPITELPGLNPDELLAESVTMANDSITTITEIVTEIDNTEEEQKDTTLNLIHQIDDNTGNC